MADHSLSAPSVLFFKPGAARQDTTEPAYFQDLSLDQLVETITAGHEDVALLPYFYAPVLDVDSVHYRQRVFHDLENSDLYAAVEEFIAAMRQVRKYQSSATSLRHQLRKQRCSLDAAATYCTAVRTLLSALQRNELGSTALRVFRKYLTAYVSSTPFQELANDVSKVSELLAGIRYCVHVHGNHVQVSYYHDEPDYSAEIATTFARFQQQEPLPEGEHRQPYTRWSDMNAIDEYVLSLVARLHSEAFSALTEFTAKYQDPVDPGIAAFTRESHFYLAYSALIHRLTDYGLAFCYPSVAVHSKNEYVDDGYDLALATKLTPRTPVVCNSYSLSEHEQILVVTGPNQGGKTTFARMFGQLHYLAALGCPVPARSAHLMLPDQIFTHFERQEDLMTSHGRLEADLTRIHQTLQQVTESTVVVMNETFSGTTAQDALYLGREILERLISSGVLAVYVTFIDELATLNEATVSMVGTVEPQNPSHRTFRLVRQPPDGRAYAAALAEQYGLTYELLRRRLQ